MNVFAYVKNSPINYVDPYGTQMAVPMPIPWVPININVPFNNSQFTPDFTNVGKPDKVNISYSSTSNDQSESASDDGKEDIPWPKDFSDPNTPPNENMEWRGKGSPESGKGNWYDSQTGEKVHPDLNHPPPKGPQWGYKGPKGSYDLFPNGEIKPN